MPLIDVYVPDGALAPDAESDLVDRLTTILLTYEGFDPADKASRKMSWVFLHRPTAVYVAGVPANAPRYKIVPTVPEGQFNETSRAGLVAEVAEAVLDAEHGKWPRDEGRVWVFPTEIPEGQWGALGRIVPLSEILKRITDDPAEARAIAAKRIATSREERNRLPEQ